MKTKSGKFRTLKAALLVLIMVTLTIGSGYGQLVGFNGKLPKKNFVRTKYKCKHVGVQKVKHVKLKTSPKQEVNALILNKTNEYVTASLVKSTPTVFSEPELVIQPEPLVELKEEPSLKLLPQPVYFRYDSYRLDIIDLTQVALAVEYVNEGKAITLIGHADNWGSEQYNDFLSLKRATIIKDMMVKLGCNPDLITVKGEGEKYPVASNDHEVGRQNNRRVEFILSDKTE